MSDIRREQRSPKKLPLLLSHIGDPFLTETASTENVSPHGLRVHTEHPWKRDAYLIVQSSANELWARGKVVYCQTLSDKAFAIGLELTARTGEWIMRSAVL